MMHYYKPRTYMTASGAVELTGRQTRVVASELGALRRELSRAVKAAQEGDCGYGESMIQAIEGSELVRGTFQGPAFDRARRAFERAKAKVQRSCRRR